MSRGNHRYTQNKRRQGHLAVVLPWLRRFGIMLVCSAVMAWAGAWFFMSGADARTAQWAKHKALELSARMGFTIENILVEGRVYTDADILRAVINVQPQDPLFSFDPAEAKALIERIGWVRHAHVERRLPGTIYIVIDERKPVALWQKDKKLSLIDSEGQVITTEGLGRFKDLLVVVGEDAPQNAPAFVANLSAEVSLLQRARAAQRIGSRRWDLVLDKDITVNLPEEDVGLALRRLALAQQEDGLLDKEITNIDLREPDRMIVRTRPGAVQEYKAGLKPGDDI
jgi:cell division protein FtsQ